MSNSNSLGQRDFTGSGGEALIGCSTSQVAWATGDGDLKFGRDATDDYPIPRFISCSVPGTLICTGHAEAEAAVTRVLAAGQILHFRPKTITATGSTAEIVLEW